MLSKNFNALDIVACVEKKKSSETRMCTKHKTKKVKYYCEKDDALLCSKCLVAGHLGHKLVDAKVPIERE